MKRLTVLLSLTVIYLLFQHPAVSARRAAKPNPRYVDGQIIVKLRKEAKPPSDQTKGIGPAQLADLVLPEIGLSAESLDPPDGLDSGTYLLRIPDDLAVEDAISQAQSDPRVSFAEPDYYVFAELTPNDLRFNEMWGLLNNQSPGSDIAATAAWDLTTGSEDVVVAMTDTGVDLSHPDLAPNIWVNPREIPGNGVDDDANGMVDDINGWNFLANSNQLFEDASIDFHGTHASGTIGAVGNNGVGTTGVAWHVKLMPLKFLGATPGTSSNAVKCIKYAIDQKKHGVNVRAINASWGGPSSSQSLHDTIVDAGDAGIVFVCAAGNGGADFRGDDTDDQEGFPEYPSAWSADVPSIISVAALSRDDSLAAFSNFGHSTVTVGAPGVTILSTVPGGGYATSTGTSMSTPHVTGIVALLAAYSPQLSPAQIKQRLIRTASPVLSVASKVIASGRANAYNALTDRVVPPGSVGISGVRTNKKFVYVDGLNFVDGSSVVEVNGVALPKTKYDQGYALANGTLTRLFVKLGKPGVKSTFPQFSQVFVTVFNPSTGQRSVPMAYTRF